ncbi:MAG: RNA-binding S4 domain-containing protein [Gammaproteobacteria bacterium]|nr:RNA-binding S4 domain-containing protein [Gammaproteobacteria bacterium]
MRLDKYLKVSHIIKRRTVAKEAAQKDKIKINGKDAKPSSSVNEGDIIEISYSSKVLKVKVLSINEFTAKKDASLMYEVIEN